MGRELEKKRRSGPARRPIQLPRGRPLGPRHEARWLRQRAEGIIKWEARRERLLEEIFRHHGPEPDVIALEEVDHFDDWFRPQLQKRGYRGFFLKKPKSPCLKTAPGSGLEDGCALFCREATVSVVCVETMNYNASNQVALLATVRVTGSSSFVVACTHLVARKTAEGEAARKRRCVSSLNAEVRWAFPALFAWT